VFASGTLVYGCVTTCSTIFATHDSGHSWTRLPARGFLGGTVLLPPSYPADSSIYAVGPAGLQQSLDAGKTFGVLVPGVGTAAVAPTKNQLLLGTNPLAVYDLSRGTLAPGPALPPGVTSVDGLAFLADGTHVIAVGERPDPLVAGQQDGVVMLCDQASCAVSAAYPAELGMRIVVSPTEAEDHTVMVYSSLGLHASTDGGRTLTTLQGSMNLIAAALADDFATSHSLVVATMQSPQNSSRLYRSANGGKAFDALAASGMPSQLQLTDVLILPGGRMLSTLTAADKAGMFGVRCSSDHGASWKDVC
jgi:photosystem II stability/assembly factor-like uncharacterized protein